jgi:transposase
VVALGRLQQPHQRPRLARAPDRCAARHHRRRRQRSGRDYPRPRRRPDRTRTQIKALEEQIAAQLAAHPDGHIFTSLPRAGTIRAARLLAEIGEARGRYPTPESLVCLAGAAPSTRQSGKVKVVSFRWAVDKQLRGAVTDFAGDSHSANAWAGDLYRRARYRGQDHPHAVRILARAWLHVIWRCWQDRVPYDPANHRALQRILAVAA